MATWRERGYVPDSDEEEEEETFVTLEVNHGKPAPKTVSSEIGIACLHSETQTLDVGASDSPIDVDFLPIKQLDEAFGDHGDPANNGPTITVKGLSQQPTPHHANTEQVQHSADSSTLSTAAKLEAEIRRGLQTLQDVLATPHKPLESEDDSPLSSPPSSIWRSPRHDSPPPIHPPLTFDACEPGRDGPDLPQNVSFVIPRRSFRPRAPIQVHPYALEDAQYRRSLRDRGMRPVRLQPAAGDPERPSEGDSQGTDAYESSQTGYADHQALPLSPIPADANDESQSPIRGLRVRAAAPELDFDEDLPDLSDILRGSAAAISNRAPKRTPRALKRQLNTKIDERRIYDLPNEDSIDRHSSGKESVSFIVPPSPPRSRGTLSSQDDAHVNSLLEEGLPGRTPVALPTPLVSSDKRGSKRVLIQVSSSSDSDGDLTNDDQLSSASEKSNNESQGVQRMQRKIRGVLPASWLRLDIKQQKGGHRHQNQPRSPVKNVLEKGVAQRMSASSIRGRRRDSSHADEDVIDLYASSESESVELDFDEILLAEYDQRHTLEDDVVEEDIVDAMLAPRQRNISLKRPQQRRKDVWPRKRPMEVSKRAPPGYRSSEVGPSLAPFSTGKARGARKKVKRKHEGPQMTILDAPGFRENDVPPFLRIASRRSGVLGGVRSQDPSKKFLKLATRSDTLDVNAELGRWRAHPSKVHTSLTNNGKLTSGRIQLHPVDDISDRNSARPNNKAQIQLTSLTRATKNTLERLRNNQNSDRRLRFESATPAYSRPSALLDYFKPRGPRHRNLLHMSVPTRGAENEAQEPDDPGFVPGQIVPLLRREPRPARTRRPRSAQSLAPIPNTFPQRTSTMSSPTGKPTSPTLQPSRLPKKQRPLSLSSRMANDAVQPDIPSFLPNLGPLNIDDEDDIVSYAIRYPPGVDLLQPHAARIDFPLVSDGLLHTTESSMADVRRLLQFGDQGTHDTTSGSQSTSSATQWSARIMKVLGKITIKFASLLHNESNNAPLPANQKELLNEVARSVEIIINRLNNNLPFLELNELKTFLNSLFTEMEMLVCDIDCNQACIQDQVTNLLTVLNRMMLLSYQIDRFAVFLEVEESARNRISETRKKLANLALKAALRKENFAQLFSYIAARTQDRAVLEEVAVKTPTAEIEAMFLVCKFGPHQSWNRYIQDLFSNNSTGSSEFSAAEALAFTIVILGCVLSVVNATELIGFATENSDSSICPFFDEMLPSAVSDFLNFFATDTASLSGRNKSKLEHLNKLKRFGLISFQWCLIFARSFKPGVAETLLKQMFKHYSDKSNNMLDFFSQTSRDWPKFLRGQIPPSELVPEADDTDFQLFLKLAAFTLQLPEDIDPDPEIENDEQLRKIKVRKQSLLFSLLPNKGHVTASGGKLIVEEHESLDVRDLAAVRNRYILISVLYHYSPPSCKPDLSQIRDLVDFDVAHDQIRAVILKCWASMTKSSISQPTYSTDLQRLAEWIQDMFHSFCDKMKQIPCDSGSLHEFVGPDQAHVHRVNRDTASNRLCIIALTWAEAFVDCPDPGQATMLLGYDHLKRILLRCTSADGLADAVLVRILDIVTWYIRRGLASTGEQLTRLRSDVREFLADQLASSAVVHHDGVLTAMTETWFAIAKKMVDGGQTSWDHFLNSWATFSFPQIAHSGQERHCHYLLMSKVAEDKAVVEKDLHFFLDEWMKAILSSDSCIKFEHHLTNTLIASVPDILKLGRLREAIAESSDFGWLYREDLINHRIDIVRHIVRTVYEIQAMDDAVLVGTLSKPNAVRLLTTITGTMKQTWVSLEGTPSREAWTKFMHEVIFEISKYSFPGFEVDQWFIHPPHETLPKTAFLLDRHFIRQLGGEEDVVDGECVAAILRSHLETAYTHTPGGLRVELTRHLLRVFSAADPSYLDVHGKLVLDIPAQLFFLKSVFPMYIERSFDDTTPAMFFAQVILEAATNILERVELRFDFECQSAMEGFAEMMVALMAAAVKAMRLTVCDFEQRWPWEWRMLAKLVTLCACGSRRWAHLHQVFPSSERIRSLQSLVQTYAMYAYEFACSAANLPCTPSDSALWRDNPSSRVRGAMAFGFELEEPVLADADAVTDLKTFAADELEDAVRRNWTRVGLTSRGPVWMFRNPNAQEDDGAEIDWPTKEDAEESLKHAVETLTKSLDLLGVGDWEQD